MKNHHNLSSDEGKIAKPSRTLTILNNFAKRFLFNFKITITILSIYLIFIYQSQDWETVKFCSSIIVPLTVLFLKIEYDESKVKKEKNLIMRNYLLSYLIDLSAINKRFKHSMPEKSIHIPQDLSLKINTYEDLIENKITIDNYLNPAFNYLYNIESREAIHNDLKALLSDILKRHELLYSEEVYSWVIQTQFHYRIFDAHDNQDINAAFRKVTIISGFHSKDENDAIRLNTTGNIPIKWNSLVKHMELLKNKMKAENDIMESLQNLITQLNEHDPNIKKNKYRFKLFYN